MGYGASGAMVRLFPTEVEELSILKAMVDLFKIYLHSQQFHTLI